MLDDAQLYILDPVMSNRPMKKNEYHSELKGTANSDLTGFVTCEPETYDNRHDCFDPKNNPSTDIEGETRTLLTL